MWVVKLKPMNNVTMENRAESSVVTGSSQLYHAQDRSLSWFQGIIVKVHLLVTTVTAASVLPALLSVIY
jgi:hypothetical protein